MNIGIVLSGGTGSRIGGSVPKQYIEVKGKRVIYHSLDVMMLSKFIDKICIVADSEWRETIVEETASELRDKIIGFADPGSNRQLSILNAMKYIKQTLGETTDKDTVFIHDAARPYLTEEMIEEYTKAIKGHDGVLPVLPMKDTVYMSEDGYAVSGLCDRSKIFAGQAPEVFVFNKYYDANIRLMPDAIHEIHGSAEPAIMAGMDVLMVEGCEQNIKITTQSDLDNFRR